MGHRDAGEFSLRMEEFLRQVGGCAIIDGGLGSELERHGAVLTKPLWSAKCLISCPHLIRQVHLDYLEAGAEVLITASYQATVQGFEVQGLSKEEAEALLEKSVQIACEARDEFYSKCISGAYAAREEPQVPRPRHVLVAASVGSYGAYLANGSEYRSGKYGDAITVEALKDFHRRRVQILANTGADLIAFETIPNKLEAQAYVELLDEGNITIPAWLSFSSKDGINAVSGDSLADCVSVADSCDKVVAVGFNCTPPRFIHDMILSAKKVTKKPILVYPNSGAFDADKRRWVISTGVSDEDLAPYVCKWREAGASLIGGCCKTTPNTIRAICTAVKK